jgi:pimeloyl-ACP methyl ester carboxylesterase
VIGVDVIAFMDALRSNKAIVAGCDWGATIIAALLAGAESLGEVRVKQRG